TYNLLPRTSALSNVELPLVYAGKGGRRRLAWEALEKVGLAQRADHRPNELSGGEQQRVAIARALINRPSLLLADEPTGNLDSRTGEDILKLFEDLHEKEGLTIVLVTHERDIALRAQRRFFIRDGILREEKG
ncbi:MAG TPA: ATP-binding cassette domain-containing protein, partial [Dehalococcoidia bacterium]|nr:ATP-binding cassette domain-containing protein [Dehalococcoidia bacterium]